MERKLYYGDNLEVLRRDIKDESVALCYIDPPFNSKRNYNQIYKNIGEDKAQTQAFTDTWEWDDIAIDGLHQILSDHLYRFPLQTQHLINGLDKVLGKGSLFAYLIHMTLRIAEIYRVLKPTGSLYLHCDPTASHYLKIVIDSLFCARGTGDFVNELVWCYSIGGKSKDNFGEKHDIIFWYSKSDKWIFNSDDPNLRVLRKPNSHMKTATDSDGVVWQIKTDRKTQKIYRYPLDKTANDYWTDIEQLNREDAERLGYPTQKPEALLERIISASSNKGDLVLDAYCGCGTTVAVAERLGRNWIGIDITYQSISLILKRLVDTHGEGILNDIILDGIPKDFKSAQALAHKKDDRVRKEFEKWAVLTYSNNKAFINDKKGGDGGIDGRAVMIDYDENGNQVYKDVLFNVKSEKTITPQRLREFYGTITREKAAIGYFISLYIPNDNIYKECKKYGKYVSKVFNTEYPVVEIITVEDILNGKRLSIPTTHQIDVLKAAKAKSNNNQIGLF